MAIGETYVILCVFIKKCKLEIKLCLLFWENNHIFVSITIE